MLQALLASISLALCSTVAPPAALHQVSDPTAEATARHDGWRADLDFFVTEARGVSVNPARPAFSPEFEEAATDLHAAIPDLTDDQVLVELMKLAAILNDGHTAVYGPGPDTPLDLNGRVLPFKFYLFPSGLYIVDGAEHWGELAGCRVVRFGELSAEEVLKRMSTVRGVDNAMTWTWMGPQFYVRKLGLLQAVGATSTASEVELTLMTRGGDEEILTVAGGDHELVRKLRPFPLSATEPPLYLSNVDANFWLQTLPEQGAVYVQFNQVRDGRDESIADFSERLRTVLRDEAAKTLIVDVRHNNGGNNTLVRPLVRALIEFEMRSLDQRIFVLMGRNTFSAAQNFINRVERWTNATFVGEPSSSSPNFVGEENEFTLPFSRLGGSLSNRYWQDSDPWDTRQWIEPDISVVLTAEDYFNGVDPVLAKVLTRK